MSMPVGKTLRFPASDPQSPSNPCLWSVSRPTLECVNALS
jgi:hypothetical protein